jgi:hypothetical protein
MSIEVEYVLDPRRTSGALLKGIIWLEDYAEKVWEKKWIVMHSLFGTCSVLKEVTG